MTKFQKMAQHKKTKKAEKELPFAFNREKYILLITGIAVSLIGFLLMIGGKSDDPNVFNESIFNFQRLTAAPVLVLAGYAVVLYTILKKPKTN